MASDILSSKARFAFHTNCDRRRNATTSVGLFIHGACSLRCVAFAFAFGPSTQSSSEPPLLFKLARPSLLLFLFPCVNRSSCYYLLCVHARHSACTLHRDPYPHAHPSAPTPTPTRTRTPTRTYTQHYHSALCLCQIRRGPCIGLGAIRLLADLTGSDVSQRSFRGPLHQILIISSEYPSRHDRQIRRQVWKSLGHSHSFEPWHILGQRRRRRRRPTTLHHPMLSFSCLFPALGQLLAFLVCHFCLSNFHTQLGFLLLPARFIYHAQHCTTVHSTTTPSTLVFGLPPFQGSRLVTISPACPP